MRRLAGALALVLGVGAGVAPGLAHAKAKGKAPAGKKGGKGRGSSQSALPPAQIELRSFDLVAGQAHVLVSGSSRPPESRLFTFTDERKRRFVPSLAECHPPDPDAADGPAHKDSGRWQCALFIPRIYQRAALVGLSVQVRGQTVAVADEQVQSSWAEARAHTPLKASAERPRAPSGPWAGARRAPDAGPTLDSDGVDSEAEEE